MEDLEEKEGARKGKEKDVTANFFIAYSFSTSFSIFIFYTGETQSQKKGCHFIVGTVVDGGIVVNKYRVPFVVNVMSSCGPLCTH